MKKYDVIVVGAGPGGATAAYYLAKAGLRVCLVDKQSFPRDKICGDGIIAACLRQLDKIGLTDWIAEKGFNAPNRLLLSSPSGQFVEIMPRDPNFCYGKVIPRLELDNAILGQALNAGADLLEDVKLTELTRPTKDTVCVVGRQKKDKTPLKLTSNLLFSADGAHASFTRSLGLVKTIPDLVAVRAYFEDVGGSEAVWEIHYDRAIQPGYAWLFPLNNGRANVGLGTYASRSRQKHLNFKHTLQQFINNNPQAKKRLGQAKMIGSLKGYPLRTRMDSVISVDDNILVVGEAAGLVNPVNGEGIGPAMVSGELAANQAKLAFAVGDFSKQQLKGYAKALQTHIGRNHAMARFLQWLLSFPQVMDRTIQRASHDSEFAYILYEVITEVKSPYTVLKPELLLKFLRG